MGDLYRLSTHYFVAGAIVKDGIIIEVAPILKWSKECRMRWAHEKRWRTVAKR